MAYALKKHEFLKILRSLNPDEIKYPGPVILKMFGALNKMSFYNENRYILCNFIDQHSDSLNISEDIYVTNNQKNLNELFLLAFNKAKESKLINALYDEYLTSLKAISEKQEFKDGNFEKTR